MNNELAKIDPTIGNVYDVNGTERFGDIPHSQADIVKAQKLLGYEPTHLCSDVIAEAAEWYFTDQISNT